MSRRGRAIALAFVGVVALGIVLRRYGWENWSLWLDECLEVFVAKHSVREIFGFLGFERAHPPLDYFVVHAMLRVSAEETWLRWAPLVWSVVTLPMIFLRAGGFARPAASIGSSFAFAVLPLAVNRGSELRPYALAVFCLAVAGWARDRERAGARFSLPIELGASIAAVYSLYISFISLGVSWLLGLWSALRPPASGLRRRLVVILGTVVAFLPWLWWLRENLLHPNEMPAPRLTLDLAFRMLVGLLGDRQAGFGHWPAAVLTAIVAFIGLRTLPAAERRDTALEFAGILAGTSLFLTATDHWFEIRYFFPALLPLSRMVGEGLAYGVQRLRRWKVLVFACLCAAFLAIHLPALKENALHARPDWRVPARFIVYVRGVGRGGPIIPVDEWSFMLLSYQAMKWSSPIDVEPVVETRKGLEEALSRRRSGWIARMEWGEREAGRWLKRTARPWSRSDGADGVELYRFENGTVVQP